MYVIAADGSTWSGAAAARQLLRILPFGWLLGWLWGLPTFGALADRGYRLVRAESLSIRMSGEHCAVAPPASPAPHDAPPVSRASSEALPLARGGDARPRIDRVAGIAVVAAPVGVHRFAEIFEDVARAAAGRLRVLDHRLERAPVALPPLFVRVQVGAQVLRRQNRSASRSQLPPRCSRTSPCRLRRKEG